MCKFVLNSSQIKDNDMRDFIIFNVIFSKHNHDFTIEELKQELDGYGCQIELEYVYNKLIFFTEKGLISQTIKGYTV